MSGLADLARRYELAVQEYEGFLKGFLLEMGLRALAKTKNLTPVDTGTLRNTWALGEVKQEGNALTIELYNPTEYASYVEFGHKRTPWGTTEGESKSKADLQKSDDWVEGLFMATVSIDEVRAEIPARYERAFRAWLKKFEEG